MADDKPHEPTPSRLARARREGDVPRSGDAVGVASFGAGFLATCAAWQTFATAACGAFVAAARGRIDVIAYLSLAGSVAGIVVAASVGALAVTYAQTRTFVFIAPSPKFAKLDPVAGLKRMFGRDAAIGVVKATVVFAAVAGALVPVVREGVAASIVTSGIAALAARAGGEITASVATALGVGALFAALDVLVEQRKWRRRLRMSFDELKRDHRQSDGDPLARGRRRQAHRTFARGSVRRVRDAAFVVTNPTHLAIALAYDPPRVAVPRVLVRAADATAAIVRAEARRHAVPIVEDVALARALYAGAAAGDAIPTECYLAVARVVAELAPRLAERRA